MTAPQHPVGPGRRGLPGPRTLAAWALVSYVAVYLFVTFLVWLVPTGGSLADRSAGVDFTSLLVMAMPVVAAVLAGYLAPPVPGARLLTIVALLEYAVALFFGIITFLLGLTSTFREVLSAGGTIGTFRYVVLGLAELGLVAVAAYVTFVAFTRLSRT
jgi:hypothetical protein